MVRIHHVTRSVGAKNQQNFVCYKREFVINVIIVTEFDCTGICLYELIFF
jgi:hypothetical protein